MLPLHLEQEYPCQVLWRHSGGQTHDPCRRNHVQTHLWFPHAPPPTKPLPLYQGAAVRIIPAEYISPTSSNGVPTPWPSWGLQDWPQTSLRHSRASCSTQAAAAGSKPPHRTIRSSLPPSGDSYTTRGRDRTTCDLRPPRCHPPRNIEYCWIAAPPSLRLKFEPALLALISLVPCNMLLLDILHGSILNTSYWLMLLYAVLFSWTVLLCSFVYCVIFCKSFLKLLCFYLILFYPFSPVI